LYRVTEMVKMEAARYGVQVIGSEVIGLCPMKALIDSAEYYLQIENFDFENQVLENHIL
ncbi:MAG: glutamate formiminotransferase, partial [Firmicutes bacterium]|nr:glutamate formiminotransferase [Bacillota bacterium]